VECVINNLGTIVVVVVVAVVVELYVDIHIESFILIHCWGLMPWMLIIQLLRAYALECSFIQLLRAHALGCFNHPKLLRAHALECLVIQTRKIVPHAYCISSCRRCIVVVAVVGESLVS